MASARILTPPRQESNAGDNRDLYIWDAFWMWKLLHCQCAFGIFALRPGKEQIFI